MSFFFALLGTIVTIIVYYFFPFTIVIAIGACYVIGVILNSIYQEIDSNFYVQTIFLVLNALAASILMYCISDVTVKVIVWIMYTIWIYTWAKEWTGYFSNYIYDNYISPYDNYHNRRNLTFYETTRIS